MNWIQAAVLGLLQGLTEFIPISSTAHLRIVPLLLGWDDPGAAASAVIQLGTLLAALHYFRGDIARIVRGVLRGIARGRPMEQEASRLGWYVAVGTLPIVVFGLALERRIETSFRDPRVVAASLIAVAILLLVAEALAKRATLRGIETIGWTDAIVIGLGQALALIPGMSRSGSTIMTALFRRIDHASAAKYSFLLGIPAIGASGIYELVRQAEQLAALGWGPILLAIVVSFASGWASIWFLLAYLRRHTTHLFIWYRIALGIVILAL